ncbi:hypothetical protein [Polaribacter vadi]|uniref:hypothetical protein n=1 Tax=Polaribacter vadi TaxID=1774273 RepID=UPI0030EF2A5D|tara:strand:- start:1700 stop:2086 length:387 start_codon:yes stop_codon:yes gene_type:complete
MKNNYLFLMLIFLLSFSINAQKTTTSTLKKSASIYTVSGLFNASNNFSAINKKLKLNNFDFVYVDQMDLDLNQFSFQFKDLGKNPTAFIYDDYAAYRDENLLKGFLLDNDPTRWNLWCPSPLSVQPTE